MFDLPRLKVTVAVTDTSFCFLGANRYEAAIASTTEDIGLKGMRNCCDVAFWIAMV